MIKYRFGIQVKRNSDIAGILPSVTAFYGQNRGAYTIEDLYHDALLAYMQSEDPDAYIQDCANCTVTTVYVRGTQEEHKAVKEFAELHSISLGKMLNAALQYFAGEEIERQLQQRSLRDADK